MWRFIGYLFLVSLAIYLVHIALIVGLIIVGVAGLIFRTKQTLSVLAFFGLLALVGTFPIPTIIGFVLLAIILAFLTAREKKAKRASDNGQMMLPFPDGS